KYTVSAGRASAPSNLRRSTPSASGSPTGRRDHSKRHFSASSGGGGTVQDWGLQRYVIVSFVALTSSGCSETDASSSNGSSANSPMGGASTGGSPYCDPTPIMAEACSSVVCHGKVDEPPFSDRKSVV